MGILTTVLTGCGIALLASGAPPGFPASGNGLWYTTPGDVTQWALTQLPIGNGFLAGMVAGVTTVDVVGLNIESLWTGGSFNGDDYTGGNPPESSAASIAGWLNTYRNNIWTSPNGTISDVSELQAPILEYGTFYGPGNLQVSRTQKSDPENYFRWLDLDAGTSHASWSEGATHFTRDYLCSHPAQACVHHTVSSTADYSSVINFTALDGIVSQVPTASCQDSTTLKWRGIADTETNAQGMVFEMLARVVTVPAGKAVCTAGSAAGTAQITVTNASEVTVVWVGDTDYSMDAGNVASNFSFKGVDPHNGLVTLINSAAPTTSKNLYQTLLSQHLTDFAALNTFKLNLGQTFDPTTSTDALINDYTLNVGNTYLEVILFNFGRYLLFSSARGTLPTNLVGKWGPATGNPWSGDYHSNINIQMNYWSALSTNLDLQGSLFDMIEKTWAPRGAISAQIIYNISRGFVAHDEMNIFGYTGMKQGDGEWANYPQSAVWMMLHVWDQFDFLNDKTWFQTQGYPLLKGVAMFHLDLLVPDKRFNDGTLVTAPCNSPEQEPITLGCAHAQQVTWMLFNAIVKGFSASGDTDTAFLNEVKASLAKMDKGIHIGSWGQLQEWKVDMDSPTDTHRHLSHLIGLYPGYALTNFAGQTTAYTKSQVLNAAEISLIHRGNGTGPDADSGWEKMWRAACWAQLQNATEFYFELSYGVSVNYGINFLSQYSPGSSTFQIDANLGYPGAVMNALIQAPDTATYAQTLVVTLLPALPAQWAKGSITNARVRGGMTVTLEWSGGKPTSATFVLDSSVVSRPVQIVYAGKVVSSFTTRGGLKESITVF